MTNLMKIIMWYELAGLTYAVVLAAIDMIVGIKRFGDEYLDLNRKVSWNWREDIPAILVYMLLWPTVAPFRVLKYHDDEYDQLYQKQINNSKD